MWYRFCRFFVRVFFFVLGGSKGVHSERIPKTGGVLLAPLHVSHMDPPAISTGLSRPLTFMARDDLFKGVFGWLIKSLGAFPIKRGDGDTEAIRMAISLLEEGRVVLVFPEGTRGDGVTIGPISRGVALLAKKTGAPVVPAGVVGTHKIMPKGTSRVRRSPVRIVFGEPFTYDQVATGANEKENRELFAQRLQDDLIALSAEAGLHLQKPE